MSYRWCFKTDDWEYFNDPDDVCPIPHGDEDYWSEYDYEDYDEGQDMIIEIDHSQDEIRGPF